jgi:CBS domain-containing protein
MMAEEDVGRVILTDNAIPVGIFAERQILKRVANNDLAPKTSSVKDVMTCRFARFGDKTHIIEVWVSEKRKGIFPGKMPFVALSTRVTSFICSCCSRLSVA